MPRLTHRERTEIEGIFERDLKTVGAALSSKLQDFWDAIRETIVEEVGIKDRMADALRLEKEVEKAKAKLARIREEMQHKIVRLERELSDLRASAVGVYSGPPSADELKELDIYSHDGSIAERCWYGFPIQSKLDAVTAIRLKANADISQPIRALEGIAQAVKREMTFAATHEAARAAYRKFHDMGFRQMGVNLPPLLEDIKGLKGDRLLETGIIEESHRLTPGSEAREGTTDDQG